MLQIFDTAQGKVVPLQTREPGKVSMYVCGPTVYGPPHLGHGRFALVFDVLRRYLEWTGLEVTYVSNITDIDDKIIERGPRARAATRAEIARRCEVVWWDAMDRIGVKRPTHDPHATAYVDQMVELIGELVEAGKAYETDDGVYLDVTAVPGYGLLARQSLESLLQRAPGSRRSRRSATPPTSCSGSGPSRASRRGLRPWGDGRPGWHTECVVMSLDLLGEDFDLHGGGQDLAFPHHENERAQAWRSAARSPATGCTTASSRSAARRCPSRSATSPTCSTSPTATIRGPIGCSCCAPTTGRRSRSPPRRSPTPSASSTASTRSPDARPTCRRRPRPRRPRRVPPAHGRRPQHAGALALVSQLVTRTNQALDIEDLEEAAGLAAAAKELCAAFGLELHAGDDEGPDGRCPRARRQRDDAKKAKDYATADGCATRSRRAGGWSRTRPKGPMLRRV